MPKKKAASKRKAKQRDEKETLEAAPAQSTQRLQRDDRRGRPSTLMMTGRV